RGQVSLLTPGGGVAWTFPDEDSTSHALYATPIVEGSTVYLADYDGRVTRLDVASGQPVQGWVAEVGSRVVATPVLDGCELYVPTADGRIVVLSAGDGASMETLQTSDQRIWGAPAFREDTLYVGDLDNGETLALNVASGDVEW